ncbi:Serine--tRNA ligase, mitochondrial [Thelotrema lepadinum]|nr:Serine--tRNA ligase, mitochondrial [Thelotrema lepadinum]
MAERAIAAAQRLQVTSKSIRSLLSTTADSARAARPSIAPKPIIDIKSIRRNPELHSQNCEDRNYHAFSKHSKEIVQSFEQWKLLQHQGRSLRERNNKLQSKLTHTKKLNRNGEAQSHDVVEKERILEEAQKLKGEINEISKQEDTLQSHIEDLAQDLPNLTSSETPVGSEPKVLEYINSHPDSPSSHPHSTSHVQIGADLDLLDFTSAASTSGWGYYFLKNEAALLEQALVQFALSVARNAGFSVVSPPSMVYSHISSACGFRPRDQSGEQQVYSIAQQEADRGRPELSLAGTAEIPFAAMKASTEIEEAELPLRMVGSSRCYRAEAGSRGVDTKGLYRVHEFTKVEMFAWTKPDNESVNELFAQMVSVQKRILEALGLHCRVLEQPSHDLGASATRKQDIEAFFPSRRDRDEGWGEVTSTSICTDYQTRRLATRMRSKAGGALGFPYTANGTALAVPRVIAAILENHWDEKEASVKIPKVLWPWMHGVEVIRRKKQ